MTRRTLLLLHGWPGSVLEFSQAIPLLTRPQCLHGPREGDSGRRRGSANQRSEADAGEKDWVEAPTCVAFDVVAPSLPGFGWSDAPIPSQSFDALSAARLMLALMERLGETHYWVQVRS